MKCTPPSGSHRRDVLRGATREARSGGSSRTECHGTFQCVDAPSTGSRKAGSLWHESSQFVTLCHPPYIAMFSPRDRDFITDIRLVAPLPQTIVCVPRAAGVAAARAVLTVSGRGWGGGVVIATKLWSRAARAATKHRQRQCRWFVERARSMRQAVPPLARPH